MCARCAQFFGRILHEHVHFAVLFPQPRALRNQQCWLIQHYEYTSAQCTTALIDSVFWINNLFFAQNN